VCSSFSFGNLAALPGVTASSGPSDELGAFLRRAKGVFELVSNSTILESEPPITCPVAHNCPSSPRMADRATPPPQNSPNPTMSRKGLGLCASGDGAQSVEMEVCDGTSKDAMRKRHYDDEEGFQFPLKPLKKAASQPSNPPISMSNKFGMLAVDSDVAGPSTSSTAEQKGKKSRMPPIVVNGDGVNNDLINKLKLVSGKDASFEYTRRGLKVRTNSSVDYRNTEEFLQKCKVEYFTFDPKPGNFVKYVLRGLPPSTECDEVSAGLTEKGIRVCHVRQVKKVTKRDGVKTVDHLPVWVVSLDKTPENLNKFKALKGILNFVIRVDDYRAPKRPIQCFKCQTYGHKAEFCHLKERCVKCAGDHPTRTCTKAEGTPARCANCAGDHSANYQGCPVAKSYRERRGVTRTPPAAPASLTSPRVPNMKSAREFPSLPKRAVVEPQPNTSQDMDGLREIMQLFTSGTLISYINKFKSVVREVGRQPDTPTKLITFVLGVCDMFKDD